MAGHIVRRWADVDLADTGLRSSEDQQREHMPLPD